VSTGRNIEREERERGGEREREREREKVTGKTDNSSHVEFDP
jgi:hypothetical protein